MSDVGWPPEGAAARLAADLLAGVATAPPDLAAAYLDPLTRRPRGEFPRVPEGCCEAAAGEAILNLCRNPRSFDPARLPLTAFLQMAARRDLCSTTSPRTPAAPADRPGLTSHLITDFGLPQNPAEKCASVLLPPAATSLLAARIVLG